MATTTTTPQAPQTDLRVNPRSPWAFLVLRLFLGVTFVYAGIQKLTDPQFFRPTAHGYIGNQITSFAYHTPLHGFLTQVAEPHAILFGLLVIYGEITIGFAMLFGFLLRPAAFFGLLLNLVFFLSATWRVYPFFYGADIVFIFCWLTLLINGPLNTGLPTFDETLTADLFKVADPTPQQARLRAFLHTFLGVGDSVVSNDAVSQSQGAQGAGSTRTTSPRRHSSAQRAREARRNFLNGLVTGSVGMLGLVGLGYLLRIIPTGSSSATATTTAQATPAATAVATDAAASTGSTATTSAVGSAIAKVSAIPSNSAINFNIPSTGDPGVLVHLDNGQFVAYDALCTHAGCQVDYDPDGKLLVCPCHGAAFDPANAAAVVQPPANTPLPSVAIHVDSATGSIFLAS